MRKYKKTSKLVNNTGYTPGYATENNPINYIPSEDITMRDTPYPVYGQPLDQFGTPIDNPTYMEPGNDYKFGGASYVAEVPAYKDGGQKSDWISHKIGILMGEGRPQKQAIAIAYSMWNQKHEMGGTQLPKMQNGEWYQNNPAGMQTTFTGAPKIDGKFNFSQDQMPATPVFEANKTEPWKYGLGANPNANSLGAVPTDYSKNFPLPAGVPAPLPKDVGYKVPTAADMAKGVQNATPNDGGAEARYSSEKTQFNNPYGDVGMEDALGFSGQQFAKGNTGMGIAGAALGALKGTKSFLQGMGAQKRQDQIMKGYAEDQRSNMTGEKAEKSLAYGGYFQVGGEKGEPIMEVNPVFGAQNSGYDDSEQITGYSDPNEMTDAQAASFMDMYNKDQKKGAQSSVSARDTWEQKTGMPWSKAKELGYTSGTANDNIKLLSELNDPRFKKENLRKSPVSRKAKASEKEDNTIYQGGELKEVIIKNPYRKKTKKSIAEERQARIDESIKYQDVPYTSENWREVLAKETQATGDKLRVSLEPNVFDDYINPAAWVGKMASNLGQAPLRAQKENSIMPYVTSIGTPLAVGASGALLKYAKIPGGRKLATKAEEATAKAAGRWMPKEAGRWLPVNKQLQQTMREVNKIASTGKKLPLLEVSTRPAINAAFKAAAKASGKKFEDGGYFQEGGMQSQMEEQQEGAMSNPQEEQGEVPQQGGGDQMQEIAQQVSQMLQQGADPQQVLQQLVQAGVPQEQAQQIIQMVMSQMQGGQQEATPQLKCGGKMYQEGGEAMDEQAEGENEGAEGETPNMEEIEGQVEQALKQGADPQQVLQQLVQMGIPEEQATQMIQELIKEIQGGETEQEAPEQGQPMMKNGGDYLAALKGRTIKNYTYNKNTGNYDVEFE